MSILLLGICIRSEGLAQADDELGHGTTWYIHSQYIIRGIHMMNMVGMWIACNKQSRSTF